MTGQQAANPQSGSGMSARKKRFLWIGFGLLLSFAITALVVKGLSANVTYFYSPTEVAQNVAPKDRAFRIGGMVEEKSLRRAADGLTIYFGVTDSAHTVKAVYTGILPDLFAEGKGVVAQGKLDENGVFQATRVLAKHDENYVAPEVAEAMDKAHKEAVLKTLK
ncbi:MAG: cytochrome c maturation protein CcmE [Burkholderiales bacterium]|jgi:cytochrome c-type biogenesis protein CcmE|nr:cytochrome c maturation protein CcmE [Burkholderiales bacterium]